MFSRRLLLEALCAGAVSVSTGSRIALADARNFASDWSEATHSAIRLLAGAQESGEALMAGIEFRLQQGFKTYWRDPGDSGVPPTFDWSGSDNAASIDVLWPVPQRFEDGGGFSIGYLGSLILPVKATPKDPARPVRLDLKLDYAICEKMCIPAQGSAALTLASGTSSKSSPHARQIADAVALVPTRGSQNAGDPTGVSIRAVGLMDGPKPALRVDAWAPRDAASLDLFVEGPKDSYFGRPSIEYPAGSRRGMFVQVRFLSPIEERAKTSPWPLRLTLVVDGAGTEFEASIAAPAAR